SDGASKTPEKEAPKALSHTPGCLFAGCVVLSFLSDSIRFLKSISLFIKSIIRSPYSYGMKQHSYTLQYHYPLQSES
ncbi:hypothetical protein, partial [Candidatus Liberibacter solanacearum]|uniref:hypothetical protein n=1 Tax=Candidatus Liberibacter solanacearum TaxID=556287 RepID=UPI00387DCF62